MRHRFHVVSLPHTLTTKTGFDACAFTQKVNRFCRMMMARGHEVYLYAGWKNDAPCTKHETCITELDRLEIIGDRHYTEADWAHPNWKIFNDNVIRAMHKNLRERDFICLIGGTSQKPIADAFPGHISVEFGIGYSGTFAKFRVFESYAWMHMVYGAETMGNPGAADGRYFDAVIPNQIDEALYRPAVDHKDYALYVGRLIDRKGYRLAQEVAEAANIQLLLAGPGVGDADKKYGEFLGEVSAERRCDLMRHATCLLAPTQYVEPFGTVTIEAMASGCPVITSDWGAFTETVEHGVSGWRCRTFAEYVGAVNEARLLSMSDREGIAFRSCYRWSMATVGLQYEEYFNRLSTLWGDGFYQR